MRKIILSITLLGICLGVKAQHNYDNQNTIYSINGNVGIGITNPSTLFQIRKDIATEMSAPYAYGNDISGIRLSNFSTVPNVGTVINFQIGATGTAHAAISASRSQANRSILHFYTEHANIMSEKMRINSDGNIGIGTTTPYSKLHVEGRVSSGRGGVLNIDWTNETNWGGSSNKWAGYVGFNAYRNNGDTKDIYYGRNKYTNKGIFEGSNVGFRWLYRNRINNDSDSQQKLSEYMRLDNNGNLGIGTTTPDSKLTVKGLIHSREVKVTATAGGADFVFENDYNLPTLEEVETYINKNKHLPEIASAKEMEKDGIHLAEMNIKLLQKIEELTLYTIQQQKEIQELTLYTISQEKKINKLEKENQQIKVLSDRLTKIESLLESNK